MPPIWTSVGKPRLEREEREISVNKGEDAGTCSKKSFIGTAQPDRILAASATRPIGLSPNTCSTPGGVQGAVPGTPSHHLCFHPRGESLLTELQRDLGAPGHEEPPVRVSFGQCWAPAGNAGPRVGWRGEGRGWAPAAEREWERGWEEEGWERKWRKGMEGERKRDEKREWRKEMGKGIRW